MFHGLIFCASNDLFGNPPIWQHIKTITDVDAQRVKDLISEAIAALEKEDKELALADKREVTEFSYLTFVIEAANDMHVVTKRTVEVTPSWANEDE